MKKSLLIVDDEPDLRLILSERLAPRVEKVHLAGNGEEALAVLALHPEIGVVISDIRMPTLDGVGFIREARARDFHRPFIFFTAYATREVLKKVVQYGVYGFIDKDNLEGLEEALQASLEEPEELTDKELDRLLRELGHEKKSSEGGA